MKTTERDFISREVFSKKDLKNLSTTGYEAFRVSPRTSTKYGQKYRKIYGATVEPDYSRGTKGNYGAKVSWFPHGYTSASIKSGTRVLQPLSSYPVDKREAAMKLMLRKRKR